MTYLCIWLSDQRSHQKTWIESIHELLKSQICKVLAVLLGPALSVPYASASQIIKPAPHQTQQKQIYLEVSDIYIREWQRKNSSCHNNIIESCLLLIPSADCREDVLPVWPPVSDTPSWLGQKLIRTWQCAFSVWLHHPLVIKETTAASSCLSLSDELHDTSSSISHGHRH